MSLGCPQTATHTLVNDGLVELEDISVQVVGGSGPIEAPPSDTLSAGESQDLTVDIEVDRPDANSGTIEVQSDDPSGPHTAEWSALGLIPEIIIDSFEVDDGPPPADVLVYVDRSCSMEADTANLAANLGTLTAALDDAGSEWQVMVATRDDGCHNDAIFTPDSYDFAARFKGAVNGEFGIWFEAGLTIAYNALEQTGPGDCNEGFLRPDASPVLLLVSDEPEQSWNSWDTYVDAITLAAPETVIHAIVGLSDTSCANEGLG